MIAVKQRGLELFCCVAALVAPGVLRAQSITISPGYTTVGVNRTVQYSATVTGLTNTTVTWSVSGVKGGNSTYGTITTGGLYTAPANDPGQRDHGQRARLGWKDFRDCLRGRRTGRPVDLFHFSEPNSSRLLLRSRDR